MSVSRMESIDVSCMDSLLKVHFFHCTNLQGFQVIMSLEQKTCLEGPYFLFTVKF